MANPQPLEQVDLVGTASALASAEISALIPVAGGGNNRLFLVEDANGARYALKDYRVPGDAGGDRLDTEFRALSFLWKYGARAVPRPRAAYPARGCALYDWVEGETLVRPTGADIEAVLTFFRELKRLAGEAEAATLPYAKEACLSGAHATAQIGQRFARLHAAAEHHAELRQFLERELGFAIARFTPVAHDGYRDAGLVFDAEIGRSQQILSPSDFGFHNALRRPGGGIVFVDFEYFGWDDPAKLASDFLLHPAMDLDDELRERFVVGVLNAFTDDPTFAVRLRLLYPLFGLRWCLILLNEFLPEGWRRRAGAGKRDRDAALERQLAKARTLLAGLDGCAEDLADDV